MEVDDPISDKFRTLVEALMAKTTSEIVKVFAEVLCETRVEISRSWRQIEELKQKLDCIEERGEMSLYKNKMTQVTCKREVNEVREISLCETPQVAVSVSCTVESAGPESQDKVQKPVDATNTRTEDSSTVPAPVIDQSMFTTAATSDQSPLNQNLEATQGRVEHKNTHACQTSPAVIKTNANPVVDPQQPSTSTNIIQNKKSVEKETVVTKKTNLQKHISPTKDSTPHVLRGRQFRIQKPCLCCTTDQCSGKQNEPARTSSAEVPNVYTCVYCKRVFQDKMELKGHTCAIVCNRCGQSFTSLQALNIHSQGVHTGSKRVFPYHCYLCSQMFATLCGWTMHKRIHTHGCLSESIQESLPSSSHSFAVPKELNAKVRLERIPHAQLEAALSYKSLQSLSNKSNSSASASQLPSVAETTEPTESTPAMEVVNNAPQLKEGSGIVSGTKNVIVGQGSSLGAVLSHSDDVAEDSVIPSPSAKIQPIEKRTPSKSLTLRRASVMNREGSLSSANDEKVMGLNSRKRKLADCNHDMYNGVFPVEKILKWRNKKGQDEVRIKWMPCTLCGAKWKNTWEPAESFVSYKAGKKEGPKSKDKKK